MAEWLAIVLVTAGIAVVGWIIAFLVNSLKEFFKAELDGLKASITALAKSFEDFKARLTKVEATCLTWEDLEKELGPVKDKIEKHDKSLSVIVTTCTMRHSKDK